MWCFYALLGEKKKKEILEISPLLYHAKKKGRAKMYFNAAIHHVGPAKCHETPL